MSEHDDDEGGGANGGPGLALDETLPSAPSQSSETLGLAVTYRERVLDAALHDLVQRLSRIEEKADAKEEVDRLHSRLLIDITKSAADQSARLLRLEQRLEGLEGTAAAAVEMLAEVRTGMGQIQVGLAELLSRRGEE